MRDLPAAAHRRGERTACLISTPRPRRSARRLIADGKRAEAELVVALLVARQFGIAVRSATIHADWTSLNSLNGRVDTDDGRRFFFKFHQEEDEEATVREYYRAEILQNAPACRSTCRR